MGVVSAVAPGRESTAAGHRWGSPSLWPLPKRCPGVHVLGVADSMAPGSKADDGRGIFGRRLPDGPIVRRCERGASGVGTVSHMAPLTKG